MTSKMDETWPMMPLPVRASVTTPRMKPIMAARPLSCSEERVKPCGILGMSGVAGSFIVTMTERREVETVLTWRRAVKVELEGAGAIRARRGVAVMKAVEFIFVNVGAEVVQ